MITKNEEDFISACLESVENLVEEIIVVDTGSTDRTPELVLAKGGKLLRLAWNEDFARARNASLLQASCPWILVLDADEILEPVNQDYFRSLLEDETAEGYFLNIVSVNEDGSELNKDQVVRLFRNKPEYIFEGAIHEQIAPSILRYSGGEGLRLAELSLRHLGYAGKVISRKGKTSRNRQIIRKQLANNQKDKFLWYCLGLECYQEGNLEEGLSHMHKALRLMSGSEGYFSDLLLAIGSGYLKLGEWEKLLSFTEQALVMLPHNPDFLALSGLASLGLGNYREAAKNLEIGLQAGDISLIPVSKLYSLLGDLFNLQENSSDAESNLVPLEFYLCALKSAPHDLYPLGQIIGLWQKSLEIFNLTEVSQFITPDKLLYLYNQVEHGEEKYQVLAPILLLLGIWQKVPPKDALVESTSPQVGGEIGGELFFLCKELVKSLNRQAFPTGLAESRKGLLILAAKELEIRGEMLKRTFALNMTLFLAEFQSLLRKLLYFYIKAAMNPYVPALFQA
ncbi:glycosyltransferase family 2 protein [Desulfosporosinus sp. PR]|uniref:glycosyltransferase family 2 protein n=1 Tax=Candidatus Desulfosporosinus nitrosoreducens TaxID=3401928 RepID=UPI0027F901B3|nr:glycosyltransferase family 2 protein [Desulfosporosinus sp. PR]MDQ7097169.1 glycosyltransferase family 2 protein [Desulfosporosinus sp. PR]